MQARHRVMGIGALVLLTALGCNLTHQAAAPTATPTATLPLPDLTEPPTATPPAPALATATATRLVIVVTNTPAAPPQPAVVVMPTSGVPPTDAASGLPATPIDVLLTDNFDTPGQRWWASADDTTASGMEGGIYYVAVKVPGRWTWRLGPQNSAVKDLVIEADARMAGGGADAVYGFICRYEPATPSYYAFLLTGDGRYRVAQVSGETWTFLVDLTPAGGVVKPSPDWNRVEVGCLGTYLWLKVNGVVLANLQDATLNRVGEFGFWAQTRGNATAARAEYDNLTIRLLIAR